MEGMVTDSDEATTNFQGKEMYNWQGFRWMLELIVFLFRKDSYMVQRDVSVPSIVRHISDLVDQKAGERKIAAALKRTSTASSKVPTH
jgi:hypothetical protein